METIASSSSSKVELYLACQKFFWFLLQFKFNRWQELAVHSDDATNGSTDD